MSDRSPDALIVATTNASYVKKVLNKGHLSSCLMSAPVKATRRFTRRIKCRV